MVCDLLACLRDRGLDTTRPVLVVIDGAMALRRAVTDVFDHPVIQLALRRAVTDVFDHPVIQLDFRGSVPLIMTCVHWGWPPSLPTSVRPRPQSPSQQPPRL